MSLGLRQPVVARNYHEGTWNRPKNQNDLQYPQLFRPARNHLRNYFWSKIRSFCSKHGIHLTQRQYPVRSRSAYQWPYSLNILACTSTVNKDPTAKLPQEPRMSSRDSASRFSKNGEVHQTQFAPYTTTL